MSTDNDTSPAPEAARLLRNVRKVRDLLAAANHADASLAALDAYIDDMDDATLLAVTRALLLAVTRALIDDHKAAVLAADDALAVALAEASSGRPSTATIEGDPA